MDSLTTMLFCLFFFIILSHKTERNWAKWGSWLLVLSCIIRRDFKASFAKLSLPFLPIFIGVGAQKEFSERAAKLLLLPGIRTNLLEKMICLLT